ncbi:MAG TPA: MFS transporter [Xanthobacteraceae bacterium]|nr:MFS transporter [Xanthobacteraceae bacterium]
MFYGWLVVAAGFAVTFVGFGCVYSFTAFIESLEHDFGASRGAVSAVFSLAAFIYFGLGSLSGPLADRFGSRRLALAGMILVGLSMAAAGAAQNLPEIHAAYGLGMGIGVGLAYVPAMGATQRWFLRYRALASGLASSGIGAGTLVVPLVAALLIAWLGWREAFLVLGVAAALIGAGSALLIANDPRERGLAPDGAAAPPDGDAAKRIAGAAIVDAVRSRRFILLYVGCLACAFGVFVPFVHLVPYAVDHGIARSSAVLLVSAIGVGSTIGRFFLGGLADRFGREISLMATFLGMALALVIWLVSTSFWPLALFGFIFGSAYGGWVGLLPAVVMDYFGGRNVSGIIGILYTSAGIGTLIGPSAAGFAFDVSHSYTMPILISIGGNLVAAALTWIMRRGDA